MAKDSFGVVTHDDGLKHEPNQKVLVLETRMSSLRSEVIGQSYEDGDEVGKAFREYANKYPTKEQVPVGLISGITRAGVPHYDTVLHALGDGWKLIAPPETLSHTDGYQQPMTTYEWWMVK